jgi:hypothetical protein
MPPPHPPPTASRPCVLVFDLDWAFLFASASPSSFHELLASSALCAASETPPSAPTCLQESDVLVMVAFLVWRFRLSDDNVYCVDEDAQVREARMSAPH